MVFFDNAETADLATITTKIGIQQHFSDSMLAAAGIRLTGAVFGILIVALSTLSLLSALLINISLDCSIHITPARPPPSHRSVVGLNREHNLNFERNIFVKRACLPV